MSKESLSNSGNLIIDLFKWRKPLVLFTFIAIVLAGIFSSPLVITPKFKSTSIIYPTTTNSISQALFTEHNPYRKDVLEFGEELEAERLLQILNSDELQNLIIEEFDLFTHYKVDSQKAYSKTLINLAFKEHFNFKRTEFMSIKLDVLDKDSELAAAMCNRVVDLIDVVVKRVKKERAEQALVILLHRDWSLSNRFFSIHDSLQNIRSFGVLNVSLQAERLTEYYAQALSVGNSTGAKLIKNEFNTLSKFGGDYYRLFEELKVVQRQLSLIRLEKENISVELNSNFTNRFIINRATPTDKKAYPIRWLIVVLGGLSAFITTLLVLYIRQTISIANID